jgi:hypothetical protein
MRLLLQLVVAVVAVCLTIVATAVLHSLITGLFIGGGFAAAATLVIQ